MKVIWKHEHMLKKLKQVNIVTTNRKWKQKHKEILWELERNTKCTASNRAQKESESKLETKRNSVGIEVE